MKLGGANTGDTPDQVSAGTRMSSSTLITSGDESKASRVRAVNRHGDVRGIFILMDAAWFVSLVSSSVITWSWICAVSVTLFMHVLCPEVGIQG